MEEKANWRWRLWTMLVLPAMVVAMVPLVVLLTITFYCLGLLGAFRQVGCYLLGKQVSLPAGEIRQKPHFLEARVQVRDLPGRKG